MFRRTRHHSANLRSQIGLPLDSVVIMANNVGCVCRAGTVTPAMPPGAAPAAAAPASASAGGTAAIMLQEQEEEKEEEQQRRRSAEPSKR